ncbi:MAG: outer membrane lipoprotein LolB [Gammaproteobacteria bacterium]|nr:outer membrane lipoprotein LolB [Gammaproteobacteria bacterium]
MRTRAAAAVLLLITGCVTLPPPPASLSWPERRSVLQRLEDFDLRGRIAVAAGTSGFNATLRWAQRGAAARVELAAPLGIGAAHIEQQGSDLVVTTSRGVRLAGEEASAAIEREFGFQPPFTSLRYWLLGTADPARPAEETLDGEQRLAQLTQDGWHVDYAEYQAVSGQWLPRRLTLTHASVRVRLLVQEWRLP